MVYKNENNTFNNIIRGQIFGGEIVFMRYILSLIIFILLINTGQSQIILLMDSDSVTTVAGGDTLGTSVIANGGSESAYTGVNEWFAGNGGSLTRSTGEQVRTGTYSAKGVTVGSGTGIQGLVAGESTYILTIGNTYWVEGYIYISTAGGQISAENNGGSMVTSTTGSWQYFKYSFVAANAYAYINFYEYGATTPVTFYVDDLTVKELL